MVSIMSFSKQQRYPLHIIPQPITSFVNNEVDANVCSQRSAIYFHVEVGLSGTCSLDHHPFDPIGLGELLMLVVSIELFNEFNGSLRYWF